MWPENTADVTTLIPVIDRLRGRFGIQRVCVMADRGMISAQTIAGLEQRGLEYILRVRERSSKEVHDIVLADRTPSVPLVIPRRGRADTELRARSSVSLRRGPPGGKPPTALSMWLRRWLRCADGWRDGTHHRA